MSIRSLSYVLQGRDPRAAAASGHTVQLCSSFLKSFVAGRYRVKLLQPSWPTCFWNFFGGRQEDGEGKRETQSGAKPRQECEACPLAAGFSRDRGPADECCLAGHERLVRGRLVHGDLWTEATARGDVKSPSCGRVRVQMRGRGD